MLRVRLEHWEECTEMGWWPAWQNETGRVDRVSELGWDLVSTLTVSGYNRRTILFSLTPMYFLSSTTT